MQELRIAVPIESPRVQRQERAATSGFLGLIYDTLRVCARNAAPVVGLAFIGFAGANVLAAALTIHTVLSLYGQQGWSWQMFTTIYSTQWLVQGAVGMLAMPFARGALTWIALAPDGRVASLGGAVRASLRRFPAVFVVSALYGVVIAAGTLGLIQYLRDVQFDLSNLGRISMNYPDALRAAAIRAFGYGIIPDAGAPFADWIAYTRFLIRRMSSTAYAPGSVYYNPDADDVGAIGAAAAGFIIVADVLLRMRTAAVIARTGSPAGALRHSLGLGVRHFGRLLAYVWALRLGVGLFMALFVWLPMTAIQSAIVPFVARETSSPWMYSTSSVLFLAAAAMVSMLFTAFSAVFDARLYKRLTADL